MSEIYVKAADGLTVPTVDNPRRYIEQTAIKVELDTYYQRLIADGDLVVVDAPEAVKKGAKNGE